MAKDRNDTQTTDAFKRRPGRPKSDSALSNAQRQRLYRERKAKEKGKSSHATDGEAAAYREEAKRLYGQLVAANREVDLCRFERSEAFRVAEIYRQRLEQAGLSTDY